MSSKYYEYSETIGGYKVRINANKRIRFTVKLIVYWMNKDVGRANPDNSSTCGLDLPEFLLTNSIPLVYSSVLTLTLTLISHLHRLKVYELQMFFKVFII